MTTQALEQLGEGAKLLLDPFGTSPQLVREAAQAGHAVLVAAANPVVRFILRHTLNPPSHSDLQAVLARISSAQKDGGRLEPFLLDLYRSQCGRCAARVDVDYFVWDRGLDEPIEKVYSCQGCNHVGEDAATDEDREAARAFGRRRLHHALALDRVAPAGDRFRHFAESALDIYPERAMYALMTVMNKLEQLDLRADELELAQALLLSTLDRMNSLWGHPEGRLRPRQLAPSPRYREFSLWRALEKGLEDWSSSAEAVVMSDWPQGGKPAPGCVAIFPGSARQLEQSLEGEQLDHILTAVPRPNQAFWTLSVLWAAWLWGRASAAPIRAALGRRRYEWTWHAGALASVLTSLRRALAPQVRGICLVTEADPGFVAATLAGFDRAGFAMQGRALRQDTEEAIFTWLSEADRRPPRVDRDPLEKRISAAIAAILRKRGEPCTYATLHAAVWSDLAHARQVAALWPADAEQPLSKLTMELELALGNRTRFRRLDQRSDIESGVFWLADARGASSPLADRVESMLHDMLQQGGPLTEHELDTRLCAALPGMETPDRRVVQACLESYAVEEEPSSWRLKAAEHAETRTADRAEIVAQLKELGERLGYDVATEEVLAWLEEDGRTAFRFRVQNTVSIRQALAGEGEIPLVLVVPGGRAELLVKRMSWDPRLAVWLERGGLVVKFRHVRRLLSDTTLRRENISQRLPLDPPERHDRQMPLL